MEGNERRQKIISLLQSGEEAISGTKLSKLLCVSRQVIVQDIALLRAADYPIIATTKGYLLQDGGKAVYTREFTVKHTTAEIEDELNTIVDNGGRVLNVCVSHSMYGEIETELIITSRRDVKAFVDKLQASRVMPLKELTDDIHVHKVEAPSEQILKDIEAALREKKYLLN